MPIKGVVLAGGLGTRLSPLTRVTNKHLLPVFDKPMIFYPIQTLVDAGVREIMILTGGPFAGDFLKLLGNGKDFGLDQVHYAYQEGEGGIAEALGITRAFVDDDPVAVILGDNLIEGSIKAGVDRFREDGCKGARIFLKEVSDPERFGVAELDGDRIVRIEEKPNQPKSNFAVTGIYFYDNDVFEIIQTLKPSGRGELEITDVNNAYIDRGTLGYEVLDGWWTDAGTYESLHRANVLVAKKAGISLP